MMPHCCPDCGTDGLRVDLERSEHSKTGMFLVATCRKCDYYTSVLYENLGKFLRGYNKNTGTINIVKAGNAR